MLADFPQGYFRTDMKGNQNEIVLPDPAVAAQRGRRPYCSRICRHAVAHRLRVCGRYFDNWVEHQ